MTNILTSKELEIINKDLFYPKFRKDKRRRHSDRALCPACNGNGLRPDGNGGHRMCVACKGIGTYKE